MFPPLPTNGVTNSRRLRICIASCELIGPIRNGGIGTAYTAMAHALATAGHDVTLFYTQGQHCENANIAHWREHYQKQGLKFIARPSDSNLRIDAPDLAMRSYETYRWLKAQSFDLVHFPEWSADAYYSLAAKRQGLAFSNTLFCVGTHSPNAWLKQANLEHYAHPLDLEVDFMERRCVALADIVVSPCQFMLQWMLENGFELPTRCYVQQNILPASARAEANPSAPGALQPVSEIVFFGRLETRKGIELFCDALDRLAAEPVFQNIRVTFLGKPATVNRTESRAYIQKRAAKWPWPWNIVSDLDQPGAMRYLKQPNRLAVIPSLMENSPYTVLECLGSRIPFLASRVGGIPELIADEDIVHATFAPESVELAKLLAQTIRLGIRPWKPAVEPGENEKAWVAWHNSIAAECARTGQPAPATTDFKLPLVSVCIAHFNRPHFLRQALASLEAQDYPHVEVIVVDDGSTNPEAIHYLAEIEPKLQQRHWRIVRQENRYLSAARNTGAREAQGEYLLFMDDDNFARPEEISTFIKVARHTGADIVTSCMDYFEGDQPPSSDKPVTRWVPLGAAPAAGYFRNVFGDANCLVKKSVFERLGGFTEIFGVTHEDWEFLANAVLKGCHLEVIPEALFHYRYTPNSMIRSTSQYRNHLRHIRPYLDLVPPALHQILLMAQGAWIAEAAGRSRADLVSKLSLKWRSQFEAAKILAGLGHEKPAREQFLAALNSAMTTEHHLVILEAMLEISRELQKFDAHRAKEILRLAVQLGEKTRCSEAVHKAEVLLNEIGNAKTLPIKTVSPLAAATAKNTANTRLAVSIVIPVFNQLNLTRACLSAIKSKTSARCEIIVVDNASTDGSAEFLRAEEKNNAIRLIRNSRNEGFAHACNQGAQIANAPLILFLNNDTQVTGGWLEAMFQAAERPHVGIVGAKLLYANNTIQHAGIGFINGIPDHPHRHAPADAPEVNQFRELDMVTGACLMIPKDLFLQLGGFDETYRNGVEDIDLCLRVRAANRKVVYEPKAVVYHLEGQSAGRFNHVSENLRIFFERWSKSFDRQNNFIVPQPARMIAASRSLLVKNIQTINVQWIGSFLDHGSLSHVNRELTAALKGFSGIEIQRVTNGAAAGAGFEKLAREISSTPASDAAVTVRHAWPPDWRRPRAGKLVVIQPWEFGALPAQWVEQSRQVDEFWVPSEYVRRVYVESGVPAAKVAVVPNGVDTEKFHPQAAPMKLATAKKFKFLFVGGTIFRKGPDALLKAYLEQFTAADDVCLVIKDFGGAGVYAGQTFAEKIRAAQAQPNAPEILYLNEELPPDALPGLYPACDCLVLPYRGEGFGLPALEAMACGLPVIVTAGGATDDFVRDEFAWRIPAAQKIFGHEISGLKLTGAGWLLEPDAAVLGRSLREAFANPAGTQRRGKLAAAHAAQQHTWKHAAAIAGERLRELGRTAVETAVKPAAKAKANSAVKITLPPCALAGHLGEAREFLRQKKFRAAWEAVLSALARRPFHPEGWLLLAEIAQHAGDGISAKVCAERARHLAPHWKPAKKFLNQRLKGGARPDWLKLPDAAQNPSAPKLSVCLIVKNEEKFLAQCLRSVREVAAQIVVVDTGSTDRTVEIAKEHGAEVHAFAWRDDFSAARNAALEHATGDWVLALDADEELSAASRDKLRAALSDAAVMAWRLPLVDVGREAEGCSHVPRLFRNAPGLFYVGRVHEQIFSSIEVRRAEWGLENRLGEATLIHHGYTAAVTRDRNKIERNLKLLERAVEELPDEPHLLMNLGLELSRSGQDAAALERYREAFACLSAKPAAEIVPELRETLLTQFCARLAAARQFEEVAQVLTSPLAQMAGGLTASLHFSLGVAQLELRRFREAADQMRQCLAKRARRSLAPINSEINTAAPWHCLALCLAQTGDAAGAEQAFQSGLKETGGEALRLDYARFLAGQNRPVEALQRLNEVVAGNARHLGAWQLGGQIALSRPEFLEFARDWTSEAMQHAGADATVSAQRAEALMLSEDLAAALELWERVWTQAPQASALAALILCQTVESPTTHAPADDAEEAAASRAFIGWYRKLIAAKAQPTIVRLNEQLEKLSRALPGAAKVLESVVSEVSLAEQSS